MQYIKPIIVTTLENIASKRGIFKNQNYMKMAGKGEVNSKIYAISDLHVDFSVNKEFVETWSDARYQEDGLIVAGDVTDNVFLLKSTLQCLKSKFREVFYVPGNHELWIRSNNPDETEDSIKKFHAILDMCADIGVKTKPTMFMISPGYEVWVVPLFSWYTKPEEDKEDSLYIGSTLYEENLSWMEQVWMDNHLCKWDTLPGGQTKSKYFAALNEQYLNENYSNIISFSHFVPSLQLIKSQEEDNLEVEKERKLLGFSEDNIKPAAMQGGAKGFNFTRYAGSKVLQEQIKQLKPLVHVYGHQHRNRDRVVDGIRYVSHCLGTLKEQKDGWVWGMATWKGPKQIWPQV